MYNRFLEYVKFDTQSDELTNLTPSTPGQMVFARHLLDELKAIGLSDISLDDNGYLMATLPASPGAPADAPTVGFIAHLDTSPDMSGRHVNPRIVNDYDGSDITLGALPTLTQAPAYFLPAGNFPGPFPVLFQFPAWCQQKCYSVSAAL